MFPAHDAHLSKYSYLVSLLPSQIVDELGLDIELRRRDVASCEPILGALGPVIATMAERVAPTLTEPLRSAGEFRRLIGDDAWRMFVERPIGEAIEEHIADDTTRGIVLTDALIGTFTHAHDLLANRCFLYHVVGRGTGHWDIPVGGMGTVAAELAVAAEKRGAELVTDTEVVAVTTDGERANVTTADGRTIVARQVFANVAPTVLRRLLGEPTGPAPEGAQVKVNMLLSRLPRLRDPDLRPEHAFAGTVHVNEGYAQLETAYRQAAVRADPDTDAVRCVLPLTGRSVDPVGGAAGGGRADAHRVRPAHAGPVVPRRPHRCARRGQGRGPGVTRQRARRTDRGVPARHRTASR